jgi:Na+/melibiose symporter-like transporter
MRACVSFRSMVNCMTQNPTSRVALASCRNAFTMVSTHLQYISVVGHLLKQESAAIPHTTRMLLCSHVQVANLGLYAIALAVFGAVKAKDCSDIVLQVLPQLSFAVIDHVNAFLLLNYSPPFSPLQYRWIAYLAIFVGCCFLVIFHVGTKEPTYVDQYPECSFT